MANTLLPFPIIEYQADQTPRQWGQKHGEEFRAAIKELAQIRKELMLSKNPALLPKLDQLAMEQWQATQTFSPLLSQELSGLVEGSGLTKTDIIILNNYTDFRDIIPDQGCSTVAVKNNKKMLLGQTWDMHRSAKNYLCLLKVPSYQGGPSSLVFSLTGCLGMMGVSNRGLFIGVNNINTLRAKTGIVWPALVRESLLQTNYKNMKDIMYRAPVTSGHNYLIGDKHEAGHFEITPDTKEEVGSITTQAEQGLAFHTNHCLAPKLAKEEDKKSLSSTTFIRYNLLEKNGHKVKTIKELKNLLHSHENHPKGICSHFESGLQDPSFTCGGGVWDPETNVATFWRGCPSYDDFYREYSFNTGTMEMMTDLKGKQSF